MNNGNERPKGRMSVWIFVALVLCGSLAVVWFVSSRKTTIVVTEALVLSNGKVGGVRCKSNGESKNFLLTIIFESENELTSLTAQSWVGTSFSVSTFAIVDSPESVVGKQVLRKLDRHLDLIGSVFEDYEDPKWSLNLRLIKAQRLPAKDYAN